MGCPCARGLPLARVGRFEGRRAVKAKRLRMQTGHKKGTGRPRKEEEEEEEEKEEKEKEKEEKEKEKKEKEKEDIYRRSRNPN